MRDIKCKGCGVFMPPTKNNIRIGKCEDCELE